MNPRFKLCLFAVACSFLLAPSAFAAKHMEFAVQDDAVFVNGLYSGGKIGFKLAQGLNASWVRANVSWSYVVKRDAKRKRAPKHVTYNWTGYDNVVQFAASRGIHVQLALTGPAPAWATGDHRVGHMKPKAGPFKEFARAAAEHFRGRVTRYSIWNEPNYVGWIAPLSSAARTYRGLYTRGYAAIKAVDPTAQVLFGETSPYALKNRATAPLKFLRDVTCAKPTYKKARSCGTLKTDGVAHHPYDFDHAPAYRFPGADNVTLATVGRLTTALSKLRKARLLTTPTGGVPYVYLTEYGYFSSGKRRLSASKQGSYLVKAFTMAQKNPRVKQMLQYLLVKPTKKYAFFDTSIASRAGHGTTAYKKLAAWAKRAAKAGKIMSASAAAAVR